MPTSSKHLTWLDLPGEIRNAIYEYVFPHQEFAIKRFRLYDKDGKKISGSPKNSLTHWCYREPRLRFEGGKTLPSATPHWLREGDLHFNHFVKAHVSCDTVKRRKSRRGVRSLMPVPEHIPSAAALLLTSKNIYRESAHMLYSRSTFSFQNMGTVEVFLKRLTPLSKSSIQTISLYHEAYHEPYFTNHIQWKSKHDEKWGAICKLIRSSLIHLETLNLSLRFLDSPVPHVSPLRFAEPFRCFSTLQRFNLELSSAVANRYSDSIIKAYGEEVRMLILGVKYAEMLLPKAPTRPEARPKARRVLIIR